MNEKKLLLQEEHEKRKKKYTSLHKIKTESKHGRQGFD